MRSLIALVLLLSIARPTLADESRDSEARRLYDLGKTAFEKHDWDTAYTQFRNAYMISQRPALLFNMASALKEGGRPGEAAETLRSYLRVVPSTPDRQPIEERIVALEEAQRILDRENKQKAEAAQRAAAEKEALEAKQRAEAEAARLAEERARATSAPAINNPQLVAKPPDPAARRRKLGLAIGLPVGAVVAIVLTLGIVGGIKSSHTPAPTESLLGTFQATR